MRPELRAFVLRGAAFSLTLICAHLVLNAGFLLYMDRHARIAQTEYLQQRFTGPIETLVVGNSHALNALPNELLPPGALNLATEGESYLVTEHRVAQILERERVGRILFPADFDSFASHRVDFSNDWFWARRVDYWELARRTGRWSFLVRDLRGRYWAYLDERSAIARQLRPGELVTMGRAELAPSRMAKHARERSQQHFGAGLLFDPMLTAAFARAVRLARDQGTEVVVVRYPVHPEYLLLVPPAAQLPLERFLAQAFDGPVPALLLDASELFTDRPTYFLNSDHLNTKGAREFSEWLAAQLGPTTGAAAEIVPAGGHVSD